MEPYLLDTISVDPEYLVSLRVGDPDHVGAQLHVLLDHHPGHHALRPVVLLTLHQGQADGLVRDEVQGGGVGRGADLASVEVVHDVSGPMDGASVCHCPDIAKTFTIGTSRNK